MMELIYERFCPLLVRGRDSVEARLVFARTKLFLLEKLSQNAKIKVDLVDETRLEWRLIDLVKNKCCRCE